MLRNKESQSECITMVSLSDDLPCRYVGVVATLSTDGGIIFRQGSVPGSTGIKTTLYTVLIYGNNSGCLGFG